MKKLLPALLLMLGSWAILAPGTAQAAPGDTTRVTIWNQRKITHYGNFDTTAVLPAARPYRKVLMHYILGRYACAPGSQYCGSWDYTTRVILRPPAHDTLELARIITPYATDWLARNLTHDYVVDVTDYAPLLHDGRSFRYEYQGYSWGFNVTVRLEFIEGTPPRNPVDVRNLYFGGWAFGNAADPINSHLPLKRLLAPAGDSVLTLKNIISGHGSDNSNCAEFCRKSYALLVNGQPELQQALWRDDCGRNQVYPQTGTWIYDRANWCPGNYVKPLLHPLNRYVQPGMAFNMKLEMPAYTNTGSASFNWTTQLVTAAGINFATDAALDEIISPNLDDNYLRQNPSCGGPVVRLRNLGRTVLTAATINYQVLGRGTPATFAWTGNLPFGADTLLTLPPLPTLLNATGGKFRAWVSAPDRKSVV